MKSIPRRPAFFAGAIFFLLSASFFAAPPARAAEENVAPTATTNNSPAPADDPAPTPPATAETQPIDNPPPAAPQPAESERLTFMSDERAATNPEAPSTFGLLAKSFGALLLIVGLIFAAGWGLKRYGGARFGASAEDAPTLSVLSTVPLGDRRSLAVVKFGARTLLVGSTQHSITLLAEEATEEIAPDYSPARSVAEMLKQSEEGNSFAGELDDAQRRLAPARGDWPPDGVGGEAC